MSSLKLIIIRVVRIYKGQSKYPKRPNLWHWTEKYFFFFPQRIIYLSCFLQSRTHILIHIWKYTCMYLTVHALIRPKEWLSTGDQSHYLKLQSRYIYTYTVTSYRYSTDDASSFLLLLILVRARHLRALFSSIYLLSISRLTLVYKEYRSNHLVTWLGRIIKEFRHSV